MWKDARPGAPLSVSDVMVIQLCEPIYSQMALMTGPQHSPVMPCRMAVSIDKSDPSGKTLLISFHNTEFIFPVYFIDAMMELLPNLPPEMQAMFMAFPSKVKNELVIIRDYAVANEILDNGLELVVQ